MDDRARLGAGAMNTRCSKRRLLALLLLCCILSPLFAITKRVAVFGASVTQSITLSLTYSLTHYLLTQGYIGRHVVKQSVLQGYETYAIVRDGTNVESCSEYFNGANIIKCDVTNEKDVYNAFVPSQPYDAVISCLASRSGVKDDSFLIDYQATSNCVKAAKLFNSKQFILLSAICVRKPLLQFQKAKLIVEKEILDSELTYSIVRPTAFMKSISVQLKLVLQGFPYILFGDGQLCKCNPIAEIDLAKFMLNCIKDKSKQNQILEVGGPDVALTKKQQAELIFELLDKKPKFIHIPVALFDLLINMFEWLGSAFDSKSMLDNAELGRIGKYYATEDMVTTLPQEKYGEVTMRDHYIKAIQNSGGEYDPYSMYLYDFLIEKKNT